VHGRAHPSLSGISIADSCRVRFRAVAVLRFSCETRDQLSMRLFAVLRGLQRLVEDEEDVPMSGPAAADRGRAGLLTARAVRRLGVDYVADAVA
jgi:hypothetical protein